MIRRQALGLIGAAALAGCGFELRRAPELRFRTLALAGFGPKSPLAAELRTSIDASRTTEVVDAAPKAQVVLEALADARDAVASGDVEYGTDAVHALVQRRQAS